MKASSREDARDLKDAGPYDPSKLTHIKSLLHGLSVALGTLNSSQRELTTLKGHEISPDGKLGGKGYVMTLRKFKDLIAESVNNLSDLTDTLADELTNPRWGLSSEEVQAILNEKDEAEEKASDIADKLFQVSQEEASELAEEAKAEQGEVPDDQVAEEAPVDEAPESEAEDEGQELPEEESPEEESPEEPESEEGEPEEEKFAAGSRGRDYLSSLFSGKEASYQGLSNKPFGLGSDPVARKLHKKVLANLIKAGE